MPPPRPPGGMASEASSAGRCRRHATALLARARRPARERPRADEAGRPLVLGRRRSRRSSICLVLVPMAAAALLPRAPMLTPSAPFTGPRRSRRARASRWSSTRQALALLYHRAEWGGVGMYLVHHVCTVLSWGDHGRVGQPRALGACARRRGCPAAVRQRARWFGSQHGYKVASCALPRQRRRHVRALLRAARRLQLSAPPRAPGSRSTPSSGAAVQECRDASSSTRAAEDPQGSSRCSSAHLEKKIDVRAVCRRARSAFSPAARRRARRGN